MAKKPEENNGQQTENTAATSSATVESTYNPEEVLISDEEIAAINEQYKANEETIKEGYKAQEDALNKAYGAQVSGYDDFLGRVTQQQREHTIKSAEQEKKENAYRYIAGIGDAISGVANLVGTAHGAASQQQEYNAPGIMAKAEASRKERKLENEHLNARLDELRAQMTALRGEKDLKLGELAGAKASDLATAELKRLQGVGDMLSANTRAKTNLAVQGMKSEDVKYRTDNKTTKTTTYKPGEEYSFDFGDGTGITIPGNKWNDVALNGAYALIPDADRTKRQKVSGGISVTGQYENPTKSEMLQDVIKAAKENPAVQDYLKKVVNNPIWANL